MRVPYHDFRTNSLSDVHVEFEGILALATSRAYASKSSSVALYRSKDEDCRLKGVAATRPLSSSAAWRAWVEDLTMMGKERGNSKRMTCSRQVRMSANRRGTSSSRVLPYMPIVETIIYRLCRLVPCYYRDMLRIRRDHINILHHQRSQNKTKNLCSGLRYIQV